MSDYLNRNFLLSYVASFVSLFGSKLLMISYVAFIYGATGSAKLASVVFAADWIANLFIGLLATRLIDRGDARRMLARLNLTAAAVTALFLLSLHPNQFAIAVSIIFVRALLNSAVNVARVKALVQFFDERETDRYSAVFNSSQLIAVAMAGAVGTVILRFTGMAVVVIIAVLTFLVAAGLFALVRPDRERMERARRAAGTGSGGLAGHLRSAATIIARSGVHSTAVFYIVVEVALLQATYEVLIASAPQQWYSMGESGTALFFTVEFLAYTAGIFLYEYLARRGFVPELRQRRLTVYAIGLAMVMYLTVPLLHNNLVLCLAAFSVLVIAGKVIWAHQYKRMIAHTPDDRVSSVVGLLSAVGYSMMAVCGFVFSWAMDSLGIMGAIVLDVLLLAVLIAGWERRTSRRAQFPATTRSSAVRTAVLVGTRGLEAFRPDLLRRPDEVRLIGIFTHQDAAAHLTEERAACIDRIHLVSSSLPDPPALLANQVDLEAARAVLAEILAETPSDEVTVHCYAEQDMLEAGELRRHFGLPGPYPDQVRPYLDKLEMKRRLVRAGVRVPAFGAWDPERHAADRHAWYAHIVAEVGLPFIMKPTDSAGSEGVLRIASYQDFVALPEDLGRAYEYEEFITGTMYSVNTLTAGGATVFGGVTEYLVNSAQVADGHVNADINLADSDPRVARMVAFAERALDALGRLDGAAHLELFHTAEDELVFLEVGARFKGMSGLVAMQRNYGAALVNWALEIESGIESLPYDQPPLPCFDACVPLRAGIIEALLEPDVESECEMLWEVHPGQRVEQTDNLVTTGGTFLVSNPDYDTLYRDFYALRDCQPISYLPSTTAA